MTPSFTRRQAITLAAAAVVAARAPAFAAETTAPSSGGLSADRVGALLAANSVPGAGLAIIDGGEIVATYGYGIARRDDDAPVTPRTRFQAASLSKTINALLILSLVKDGLLKLDDPVNRHLTSWTLGGPDAGKVTVRMLLSHTGGTNVHGFGGYDRSDATPTLGQILDGEPPANSPPIAVETRLGRFAYSGGGVTVLQQMVVDVTGKPYADVAYSRVLSPLGMADSSYQQPPDADEEHLFSLAHSDDGRYFRGGYHLYPELAAAGLWTTPGDLARVVLTIIESLNGDGAILPSALARQMVRPVSQGAALGTFVDSIGRFNHSGSNLGFRSIYWGDARMRKGVIAMSNGENGDAVNNALVKAVVARYRW